MILSWLCSKGITLLFEMIKGNSFDTKNNYWPVGNGWREWVGEVTQSCPTLCYLMDCTLPGSSIHRIFQVRILEWIAISFSRGSSWPRNQTQASHTSGRLFTIWATREAQKWVAEHGKGRIFSFILKSDSFILYSKQKTGKNVFLLLFSHLVMSNSLQPHGLPAHQASLSFTISQSLLNLISIELMMSSNYLIICHPLLLLPSIFPSIRVFSNESSLHSR